VGQARSTPTITNAKLPAAATAQTSISFAYPGTVPAMSANGNIEWHRAGRGGRKPGVLHAYEANNLATELFNSTQIAVFGPLH